MTKEELSRLSLNTRVKYFYLTKEFEGKFRYGYVVKIYNGNHQVKVWFDGEPKAVVVGYTQIKLIATKNKKQPDL